MSLLGGVQLTLLIGPTVPVPAPPKLIEALDEARVEHTDEGRSAFQITFRAGRSTTDLLDYPFLASPLLRPCSRVVLIITFRGFPQVLMDGIITNQQLQPGREPGTSTLTVMGEDVSVKMDLEEKSVEHPAQPEVVIVTKLIASYAQYGLIPKVIPPPSINVPVPTERIPVQQGTDLEYLQEMAGRFGYVFYVTPGPAPLTNTAYWGPPERLGVPQKGALRQHGPRDERDRRCQFPVRRVGAGIHRRASARSTHQRNHACQDARQHARSAGSPTGLGHAGLHSEAAARESGLDIIQAFARAQGRTDASVDRTIRATGELDALVYEGLLKPHGLVGMRGVGYSYDGLYYVKRVTHSIRIGQYTQRFELRQEGLGAITPVLLP